MMNVILTNQHGWNKITDYDFISIDFGLFDIQFNL